MGRVIFTLLIGVSLLSACARKRPGARAAGGRAYPTERRARAPLNPNVFAADGRCSDRLVRQHAGLLRLHEGILKTLQEREHTYKVARARIKHGVYWPNKKREAWAAEDLKFSWQFWLSVRRPYDKRYGEYVCVRRDDLLPLSSAEFDRGMDEIWNTVKFLGELPPPQPFEIGG